ncbi:MAG: pyridoxal 5'-phosphate synthase glutaminase subunit PdxT [Acidobacteriia bacterium]|nr:pyridoxal 5'-phosphate synthase glutaminase subunit PdxT [Terriglobia bacterium]
MNRQKTVGVLALQGDFEKHRKALERAGARALEVRTKDQLAQCDGLIIPGGESTTMLKLLDLEGLTGAVREFGAAKPIYGTCAGAILLAHQVTNPPQASLDLMDISVERNAYGRQIDSRIAKVPVKDGGEFEAVFIRAPIIRKVGEGVNVLASYAGDPVWVEEGRHMVTTFHPELTDDDRVHRKFIAKL